MMTRFAVVLVLVNAAAARADFMDHFATRDDVGPHKAPYLGDAKVLLMPVEVKGFPPLDVARLEQFFSPDDPNGFVRFYETASLGRYRPRVVVGPKITYDACPVPEAQFPGCKVNRGDINAFVAGQTFLREVVARTRDAGVDFKQFDLNGRRGGPDGWSDGVMLLTNIPFGGIAFPIGYFNQADNLAGGTGGPLVVNGVRIAHIAIAGDTDVFVMVHEFGHLLGLTDLYDEYGAYAGLHLSFMGSWLYDSRIVLPDAETRFRLRWANWHQVQGRRRVTIRPAETSGDVYRVGTGDEYFLIENRGPGGQFDTFLATRGLAVFHIDRTVRLKPEQGAFVERLLTCVNCDAFHPYTRLLQADGRADIEFGLPFKSADDLFHNGSSLKPDPTLTRRTREAPVFTSNFYSGAVSGFALNDVRQLDNGDIEVTLDGPAADQCDQRLCDDGEGCAPITCTEPVEEKKGCSAAPPSVLGLLALALAKQGFGRRQRR